MWEFAGSGDVSGRHLMEEALEEVSVTLEELRTTGEIVQQQNVELAGANRSLVEKEQRYHELFTLAPDAYLTSSLDAIILEANRAATLLLGFSTQLLIGTPIAIYLEESERPAFRQQLALMKSGELETPKHLRMWMTRRREASFASELTVTVARDAEGSPAGFRWTIRDVTDRREVEESLRQTGVRLNKALEELQNAQEKTVEHERLRALGQMASGVAHDFNNALSGILGFTEILLDRKETLDDKPKVLNTLKLINTGARDAAKVVTRLREFYRPRRLDDLFLPVDVNRIVSEAISYTQPRWKDQTQANGVAVEVTARLSKVPPVAGNESELRDVLTNLIFNAVDALPQGGRVEIVTRLFESSVVLEVRDSGTGMTEEIRRKCLEPFYSTKGASGSGLGLAMVYGTLQRHEGTIDIESAPSEGTTVRITLPAYTSERGPNRHRPAALETASPAMRVLVVEDMKDVRELLVQYLLGDGHQVKTAANGREALELFREDSFDLVITDRAMPEMNGDQLTAAIKDLAPNEPVIMLTGFSDFMTAAERPRGVDHVLSKPVTLEGLRRALAQIRPA